MPRGRGPAWLLSAAQARGPASPSLAGQAAHSAAPAASPHAAGELADLMPGGQPGRTASRRSRPCRCPSWAPVCPCAARRADGLSPRSPCSRSVRPPPHGDSCGVVSRSLSRDRSPDGTWAFTAEAAGTRSGFYVDAHGVFRVTRLYVSPSRADLKSDFQKITTTGLLVTISYFWRYFVFTLKKNSPSPEHQETHNKATSCAGSRFTSANKLLQGTRSHLWLLFPVTVSDCRRLRMTPGYC